MRKTYRLSSWKGWDRHVDRCAREFAAEFGVMPNLLVASPVTLRRINVAADKGHVGNGRGQRPTSYVQLRGFATAEFALTFVQEDGVAENSFALIRAYASIDELKATA